MSDMPWFKFYASDWLSGTRGLSATETGIYITLIAAMYDAAAPLINDPVKLARLCGATVKQFNSAISELINSGKIFIVSGKLWNARVDAELKVRSSKSEKAKQSAETRWSEKSEQKQRPTDANAMRRQCETDASQKSEVRSQKSEATSIPVEALPRPKIDPHDFDAVDAALRKVQGISNHPVFVAPVIAPIWALVQSGFDLKTEIIPTITECVKKSKGRITSWSYFVSAITEAKAKAKAVSSQAVAATVDWSKALNTARRMSVWKPEWGPIPGETGCLCPPELLQRGDGAGWEIYQKTAA